MENSSPKDYMEFQAAHYLYLTVSPLFLIAGIVGNVVSFCVFYPKVRKSAKQSSYCYLSILAVFDTLSLVLSTMRGFMQQAFGLDIVLLCKCGYYLFFNYLCTDMSVYIIVCMTVDRAISVFIPFKAKTYCTRNRALISVLVVLLVLACINSNVLFVNEPQAKVAIIDNTTDYLYYCGATEINRQWSEFIWPWVDLSILSFLPFVVLVILNVGIFLRMRRQTKRVHAMGAGIPEARVSMQRRTNILLLSICILFLATTSPLAIFHIVESYWPRDNPHAEAVHVLVSTIVYHLLFLNNCVNVLLYCWSGREFRNDLRKMCCGKGKQEDASHLTALA